MKRVELEGGESEECDVLNVHKTSLFQSTRGDSQVGRKCYSRGTNSKIVISLQKAGRS